MLLRQKISSNPLRQPGNHARSHFAMITLLLLCSIPTRVTFGQASPPDIQLYGFLLLNAAYNTGAPSPVDVPLLAGAGDEGSFLMMARQSRLGLQFRHEKDSLRLGGTIELDLYGLNGSSASGGSNQSGLRTRHAFFSLDLSRTSSLLFGQTWALVAPLNPASLSHVGAPMFTSAGNLNTRLPQIRYTYQANPIRFEAAILRPFLGEVAPPVTQSDYLTAGEYSRLPFVEARIGYDLPNGELGLSGRYGWLDYRDESLEDDQATTAVVAGDLSLSREPFAFDGEVYVGRNTRGLGGLAGTSIIGSEVRSGTEIGGWGQVSYTRPYINLNAGFGTSHVEDGIDNEAIFVNGIYTLSRLPVSFALELLRLHTTPTAGPDEANYTINFAARYTFSGPIL